MASAEAPASRIVRSAATSAAASVRLSPDGSVVVVVPATLAADGVMPAAVDGFDASDRAMVTRATVPPPLWHAPAVIAAPSTTAHERLTAPPGLRPPGALANRDR